MKKSELLLNPYKEHLKKPYLHGAGTLEIDGVQYSADEYITILEEENRKLEEALIDMTQDKAKVISERIILEEENAELKSELSKFSEAYKRYRDYEKEELAESCYDLARENEKLKEEIGKLVMKQ